MSSSHRRAFSICSPLTMLNDDKASAAELSATSGAVISDDNAHCPFFHQPSDGDVEQLLFHANLASSMQCARVCWEGEALELLWQIYAGLEALIRFWFTNITITFSKSTFKDSPARGYYSVLASEQFRAFKLQLVLDYPLSIR
ncbi:hypothetical protein C8J56DRAFT_1056472 [Mycena floridula]|nr:hypothetical protein C8J56DRAFT_1056472 [Mycena floridula]